MRDGWRRFAGATAIVTYLLITFGGIVRVTGSGMGCGDDWPLCNGRLLPPWDFATWIEWGHRLVAGLVSILIVGLLLWAVRDRGRPGGSARVRIAVWITALLAVQVMLGAVTVWLELPPTSVVLHLATAMSLLALLVLAWLGAPENWGRVSLERPGARMAWGMAGLGAAVVMLGGLVANLGAGPACQGFPLCNGDLLPGGNWGVHLHWTHRVAAYALAAGALALPWIGRGRARGTAWAAAGLAAVQIAVGAIMVLSTLPASWRIAHVAAGTALFAVLIAHAYRASVATPATSVRSA